MTSVFTFQAADGIRDYEVTGVQTCALPILSPDWMVSSRLMHRINVLLPLPLGPQTTTTLPASTVKSMSLRTCSEPNHLLTLRNSITASMCASYGPLDCKFLTGILYEHRPFATATQRSHRN